MDMVCTRLWPASGLFVGKRIHADGRIEAAASIKMWRHQRLSFASLEELQDNLQLTSRDNCCLVRGTTEVQAATVRRRHTRENEQAFDDTPTTFFALDVEGVQHPEWIDDAPAAIEASVTAPLQSFIGDAGYLVALSPTAGLARNPETKAWNGTVGGDEIRCRVYFHLSEPLATQSAKALMRLMREKLPGIDIALADWIQIHYCARPRFIEWQRTNPHHDPLLDRKVPLLWMRCGGLLQVPSDLDLRGHWAAAEDRARSENIRDARRIAHPDFETAIAAIGLDGDIYPHIRAAVWLALRCGVPDNITPEEHAAEIYRDMRKTARRHRDRILTQCKGRRWEEIEARLERGRDYARWCITRSDEYPSHGVLRQCIDWRTPDEEKLSVSAGRDALTRATDAFLDAIDNEDGDVFEPNRLVRGIRSPPGLGKSQSAHEIVPCLLMRALEDDQCVVYASSRHKLSAEQLQRMVAGQVKKPLVCEQWRGRQAEDPVRPGHPMCERHEEARAVGLAGGEPMLLCQAGPARCAFFDCCGYRRQQQQAANVWFVAHSALLHERPRNIGQPVAIIIDESPMSAMLFGIDEAKELPLDALRVPPQYLAKDEALELHRFRRALWSIFDTCGVGPAPSGYLREKFGLHAQIAPHIRRMIALEWHSLAPLRVHPGMSKEAVLAAASGCGDNFATLLRISLYELLAEAIEDGIEQSGHVTIIQRPTGRIIQLCGIRPVQNGWKAPILTLDATLDMKLLQRLWPQAVAAADIQVGLPPHVRVTQTVNAPFAKSWLTGKGRETKRACEVYGAVLAEIILSGAIEPTLIVTHKAVEEVLRREAYVPWWIELAHHGDITGVDRWREHRHVVVIGRPLPSAEVACRTAEALFGEYIPHRLYTPTKVLIRIVPDAQNHNAVQVTQMRHEDPRVEAVRRQVTEAGILQAAGRGRGLARTKQNPLDIWLLTDVRIEELEPVHARLWSEFVSGPDAQMLARGVWLENNADAAVVYPHLFTSANAVKKQRQRVSSGSFIYRILSIDKRPRARSENVYLVRYCKSEVGTHPSLALFLSPVEPDALSWLRTRLGDPRLRLVSEDE